MHGLVVTAGSTLMLSMPQQNTTILISPLTISTEPRDLLYNSARVLDCTTWAQKANNQLMSLILKKLMHSAMLKAQPVIPSMDML